MQTLTQALIDLVVDGEVDEETAAAAAPNRHDFMIALDRALKETGARGERARTPTRTAELRRRRRPSRSAVSQPASARS